MKKIILALSLLVIVSATANAQSMGSSYRTALGFRFWPGGITVKHFISNTGALEGIGYFWYHGFRFTGLYEYHGDINGAAGLKWYVGGGAHIGAYNEGWYYHNYYYDKGSFSFGFDGVVGLDYKITGAPINLSLDFQPSFDIVSHPYFFGWGGLGIRFTF